MLLADLGAEVISVTGGRAGQVPADYARGKRFVHLNLKHPASGTPCTGWPPPPTS